METVASLFNSFVWLVRMHLFRGIVLSSHKFVPILYLHRHLHRHIHRHIHPMYTPDVEVLSKNAAICRRCTIVKGVVVKLLVYINNVLYWQTSKKSIPISVSQR